LGNEEGDSEDLGRLGDYLYHHPWILEDIEALSRLRGFWNLEDSSLEFIVAEVRVVLKEDFGEYQAADG